MPGGATAGTATIISSLPYTDSDTSPTLAGLWYVFTPASSLLTVVGGLMTTTSSGGMQTHVYSPDGVTTYPPGFVAAPRTKPFQIPVVAGTPYYFNVNNQIGAYTFSLIAGPNLEAPAGSIFVNDDHAGYPLALLSVVDGSVLHFVSPFPAGENGDVLASGAHTGRILVHDRADDHLKLYSPTFDLLADLPYTSTGALRKYPISADHDRSQFYVGKLVDPTHGNVATVTTVSSAGAFGPQTWVLPAAGLTGIAPNVAGTILYFTGQTTSTNSPVQRWDLINDVALTDLVAGLGATWTTLCDLRVLADDTVVVSYQSTTPATAPVITHYATDGTVLHTWTMTGDRSADVHLASALDDPVSVWIWTKNAGVSRFTNVNTTDGTTISAFTVREFQLGVWLSTTLTAPADPERFGHSFSCPFLILRATSPPIGTVTGTMAVTLPPAASGSDSDASASLSLTGYVLPPRHLERLCYAVMTLAALAPDARQRIFSSLGVVVNGARLYSYVAGSSVTPLATYNDSGLTIANPNPLIADAGGLFGPIYLLAQAYHFVLRTSTGELLFDQDDIWDVGELLQATIATLQAQVTANSLSVVTATATHTAALNTIVNCTSGTFTVTLPAASTATAGHNTVIVKNSGAGTITVARAGSDTIDGATSYSLNAQYKGVTLVANAGGTAWLIIEKVS